MSESRGRTSVEEGSEPVLDERAETVGATDGLKASNYCAKKPARERNDCSQGPSSEGCDYAGEREGEGAGCAGVPTEERSIAVLCVGNKLMLDDGIGPAVYEELVKRYEIPDNVRLYDIGCLSMDMLFVVDECDVVMTVDAVDGTGKEPGTVFRFAPDAMARHSGATASLHDLKLVDLFDAAMLLGYEAQGLCLGMQVENPSPAEVTIGLTPKVYAALPLLVETVVAELHRLGTDLIPKAEIAE